MCSFLDEAGAKERRFLNSMMCHKTMLVRTYNKGVGSSKMEISISFIGMLCLLVCWSIWARFAMPS